MATTYPTLYPLAYPVCHDRSRPPAHNAPRDGPSHYLVGSALAARYPNLCCECPICNHARLTDIPRLTRDDFVLMTTRPPMDDDPELEHRAIRRSDQPVERAVFAAVRPYIAFSSRTSMRLSDTAAGWLAPGRENRAELTFRSHRSAGCACPATCTEWRDRDGRRRPESEPEGPTTVACLLITRLAWDGCPTLILSFGMTGLITQSWNRLLTHRWPARHPLHGLLTPDAPRFVLAELRPQPIPERAATVASCVGWAVELLINQPLVDPNPAATATRGRRAVAAGR